MSGLNSKLRKDGEKDKEQEAIDDLADICKKLE